MFREFFFLKCGLKFVKRKNCLSVHKTTSKKEKKLRNNQTKKYKGVHNLWILGTKLVLHVDFWDHIFPRHFFCFLFYTPKCVETCVNCVTKCLTNKIYKHPQRKDTRTQWHPFIYWGLFLNEVIAGSGWVMDFSQISFHSNNRNKSFISVRIL